MTNQFLIKFAWKCNHEDYGEILSFIVSPKINTYANVYGYNMSKDYDEVVRFPTDHPQALSLISKLARVNSTQWAPPTFGDYVDEGLDVDEVFRVVYGENSPEMKQLRLHLSENLPDE